MVRGGPLPWQAKVCQTPDDRPGAGPQLPRAVLLAAAGSHTKHEVLVSPDRAATRLLYFWARIWKGTDGAHNRMQPDVIIRVCHVPPVSRDGIDE